MTKEEKKTTRQSIIETVYLGSDSSDDDAPIRTTPTSENTQKTVSTSANETTASQDVFTTSQDLTPHTDEKSSCLAATAADPDPVQVNPELAFLYSLQDTPCPSPEKEPRQAPSLSPGRLSASSFARDPFAGWSIADWIRALKKNPHLILEEAPHILENPVILFSIINQVPALYTQVRATYNKQARIQLNTHALIINEIPSIIKSNILFVKEIFSDSELSTNEDILKSLYAANKANFDQLLESQTIKLQNLPLWFQEDFDFVLNAVKIDGLALQYASNALKKNLAIIISALNSNLEAKAFIDQEFQNSDPYLKKAMQEEILYKTLPEPLQQKVKQHALIELEESLSDAKLEQIYQSFASSIQKDAPFFYSLLEKIEAQINRGQTSDNNLHQELEKIIQFIGLEDFVEPYKQLINAKIIRLYSFEGSGVHSTIWCNTSGTFRWSCDELEPILKDIMYSASFWQAISQEDFLKPLRSTALEKDGLVLGFFPDIDRAKESLVFKAVQQNGLALEFGSDELRKNHPIVFTAIQNKMASQFISSSSLKALADKLIFLKEIAEKEDNRTREKTLELVKQIQEYVMAHPETEEELVRLFEQYHTSKDKQMNGLSLEFAFKLHRLVQHKSLEPQTFSPLIDTFHHQYQLSSKNDVIIQLIQALDTTNEWLNGHLETKIYQQFAENLAKDKSLGMKTLGVAMLVFASLLVVSGIAVAATGMGLAAGAGISALGVSIAALQIGFFNKKPPLSPIREQINALIVAKSNHQEREKEETTAAPTAI